MSEYLIPIIVGVVSAVVSSSSSAVSSHQQTVKAHEEARKQRAAQSIATQKYLESAQAQNRGQMGQARLGAYQNLASQLAARGWGAGSGIGTAGAAEIEGNYLKGLANQNTELVKQGQLMNYQSATGTYPITGQSSIGSAVGAGGQSLNQALGYYQMSQLYGQKSPAMTGSTGITPTSSGYYGYQWPTDTSWANYM